jgi:hypothetical protein
MVVRSLEQHTQQLIGLEQASLNAERAFNSLFSPVYAQHPELCRHTWAAAAILHCDILRYVVSYEHATRQGLVRLLWMGDIVSMLYEARDWFFHTGGPNLIKIASLTGDDVGEVQADLKRIKKLYPLDGIDFYKDFRNKVGHHYDPSFVFHLHQFSGSDSKVFFEVLDNYVRFSAGWIVLCKRVISHRNMPES